MMRKVASAAFFYATFSELLPLVVGSETVMVCCRLYLLNQLCHLRAITPNTAYLKIPLDILEVPFVLSVKIIGTSTILKPYFQLSNFISIWKA
jgi:hypothetical protein